MSWIYLAHALDQWWAVVKAVINFRVSYKAEDVLTNSDCTFFCRSCLFLLPLVSFFPPAGMTFIEFRLVTIFVM